MDLSLCFQSEDIEFIWSFLNNLIGDAINKFVPTSSTSHNKQPIWFNSNIRHHIKCLRTLRCKFNKRPTDNNKMKNENSSNLLQAKITSAKANYESDLIMAFANNNNPRVYKYIRSLTKSHIIPPTLHYNCKIADSNIDKANMFNDYFYFVFTQAATNQSLPTENSSHLSSISITEEDVYNALINLDTSKAMGPDGIPPIVLSKCASVLCRPFHYLFSLILKYGYLLRDWKIHKIIPCF